METIILKLAFALIPLILLGASVYLITTHPNRHSHHPMAWNLQRRRILVLLR